MFFQTGADAAVVTAEFFCEVCDGFAVLEVCFEGFVVLCSPGLEGIWVGLAHFFDFFFPARRTARFFSVAKLRMIF